VPVQVDETYIPVASITRSAVGARALSRRPVPNSSGGIAGATRTMADPSIRMSIGPRAGFPVPSTIIAFRMSSLP
jgi:hypothetical protein